MAKFVALLGYPLGHSVSKSFQEAAFASLGLDVRYEPWEIKAGELPGAVERLRQPQCLGANVTIPHKEVVIPFLEELEPLAGDIEAVNAIANEGGRLKGYNTDASGFLRSLHEQGGFSPQGKAAAILGAGGVARAVAYALLGEGVSSLLIANRTLERAVELVSSLRRKFPTHIEALSLEGLAQNRSRALSACQLIVNCTSLGMMGGPGNGLSPLPSRAIPAQALVYDLVYNPEETPFLREARVAGARVLGGLSMLVYQGAAAFRLWTGCLPPEKVMFKAAREALYGR